MIPDCLLHAGLHVAQAFDAKFRTDSKDNIGGRRKQITIQAKHFPYQPFYPVTSHRVAGFPVDTDSQAIVLEGIGQDNQSESITAKPSTGPVNPLKLPGRSQEMTLRERMTAQMAQAANCLRPFARLLLITA